MTDPLARARLEKLARAATQGDWAQGRLLNTRDVARRSDEWRTDAEYAERRMVFTGFSAEDEGRSRQRVLIAERPEDAAFVAASSPAVVLSLLADSLPREGEWRDIASAPDGVVLLWLPGGEYDRPQCRVGHARSKFGTASKQWGIKRFSPTHWMLLPAPPAKADQIMGRDDG